MIDPGAWEELVAFVSGLGGQGSLVNVPGLREECSRFLSLLLAKNEQVNLTALKDVESGLWKHLADSLSLLAWEPLGRVADWGSGGGFPGIPLALVRRLHGRPANLVFVDSVGKKVRAIEEFCSELGLRDECDFRHGRGEDLLRSGALAGVDTVVMRAVAPAERAVHWIDPKIAQWVLLLGPRQLDEWRAMGPRLGLRGMTLQGVHSFSLPHGMGDRHLLRIAQRAR